MPGFVQRLGSLLYLVSPNATTFQHEDDVPNYVDEVPYRGLHPARIRVAVPVAYPGLGLGFPGYLVGVPPPGRLLLLLGSSRQPWLTSKNFLLFEKPTYSRPSTELIPSSNQVQTSKPHVWNNFLLSRRTFLLSEINFLWAVHQTHHSSEDFTLSTALRLSVLQRLVYFGFYQPLALLGIPKASVVVHLGFNYLFQFWVHTDVIRKLGPIEWVFSTPSHHRVHHGMKNPDVMRHIKPDSGFLAYGSNKWCLDKNYGSVLIIWDRIFGTFQEERDDEEIVYGLVDQPQSMNGVWHEFYYFEKIYEKAKGMSSWSDSLKAVFYGPGWFPGTPRLGDPDTFPDVKAPRRKYDPQMPLGNLWCA
ncbi:alkylglycerol monooxygenase-like [Penaeus japonicus]|uniref:alkylglycerol monooxygenase-like n=1 Tax=Penaeus japonicus TaxID=27405 RepID=UPI001C7133DE|nr:alkylglycerol monooxygenase-like [Penaeus japonicus]